MKKLTVDRCRKQILRIKKCISEGYVSINERDYLQALEIALPILEQQERGEGDWIEWGGGLVAPVTGLVEVRFRCGREEKGCKAEYYSWARGLGGLTIIAYRIIRERATNQNGEQ